MNDNECFLSCFRTAILGALLVIALLFGSCQTTNYRIVQAIEAGATPLEAECALSGSPNTYGCIMIYAGNAESIR